MDPLRNLTSPAPPSAATKPLPPPVGQEPRELVQLGGRVDEPLTQALTLVQMHQNIPAEYLTPETAPGPAEPFRDQARKLLPQNPTARQVELTALSLFEQSATQAPRTITLVPCVEGGVRPGQGLAESGLYTAKLAAALGGPAFALSPALMAVLGDFKSDQLWTATRFEGSNSQYRAIGEFRDMQLAHLVTSPMQETPQGHRMRGILDPQEAAHIEMALADMESKIAGSTSSFGTVHVRTVLGESQDPRTGLPIGGVQGLAGDEEIGLSREVARDLNSCKEVVYHEAGHELDRERGQLSLREDSPFGKTSDPQDYVSEYARTFPWEDLAETNRVLFSKFEAIQAQPDLWLHARGEVGKKLAFLLKEGYGMSVPPPSPRWSAVLASVQKGDSPFGWESEQGTRVLGEADLRRTLRNMTTMWDGIGEPPAFLGQGPDGPKQRWVAEKLLGITLPETPAAPPMGLGGPMMGFGVAPDPGPQSVASLKANLRFLAGVPMAQEDLLSRARAELSTLPEGRDKALLTTSLMMLEGEVERRQLGPLYRREVNTGEEARALLTACGAEELAPEDGPLSPEQKSGLMQKLFTRSAERVQKAAELARPYLPNSPGPELTLHPLSLEIGQLQTRVALSQMAVAGQLSAGGEELARLLEEPGTRQALREMQSGLSG